MAGSAEDCYQWVYGHWPPPFPHGFYILFGIVGHPEHWAERSVHSVLYIRKCGKLLKPFQNASNLQSSNSPCPPVRFFVPKHLAPVFILRGRLCPYPPLSAHRLVINIQSLFTVHGINHVLLLHIRDKSAPRHENKATIVESRKSNRRIDESMNRFDHTNDSNLLIGV
jgi:hypothetical protein